MNQTKNKNVFFNINSKINLDLKMKRTRQVNIVDKQNKNVNF